MRNLLVGLFVLVGAVGVFFFNKPKIPQTPTYQAAGTLPVTISIFDQNVPQVVQIDISPDSLYMLVGTLDGTIWVYEKKDGVFQKQKEPFFVLQTAQPGFPPEEAGLTGIVFGVDFDQSHDIFLLYSYALEKKSFRNRITRVTFTKKENLITGIDPKQIFESNTPGTGSHQIQDGVGVTIENKPHLLFTVGEGFDGKRALDPLAEAGKVMLIGRDGEAALGSRPFPQSPKVQALGIRNAPAIAKSPVTGKIAIGDTGPNNYDRFLYGTLYDQEGDNTKELSFNWDGSEGSLQKKALDLYDNNYDMVLYRWSPTETAVNIAWLNKTQLFVVLFGQTGAKTNSPGKKIMLGTLTDAAQPTLSLEPFIERTPEAEGTLGHPIGLAVDPTTHDIYFGDIMEGRIYKGEVSTFE